MRGRAGGHLGTDHIRKADTGLFEHLAAFQHSSAPAAAFGAGKATVANIQSNVAAVASAAGAGAATVEFWLHNRGPVDLGTIVLRCGDLLAHDGSVIDSRSVGFEPGAVPMPARSSRGVLLSVDVPPGAPAGTYRGTVLADGHDDVWLPLVLSIEP
mgnify:CR=1 FL=1